MPTKKPIVKMLTNMNEFDPNSQETKDSLSQLAHYGLKRATQHISDKYKIRDFSDVQKVGLLRKNSKDSTLTSCIKEITNNAIDVGIKTLEQKHGTQVVSKLGEMAVNKGINYIQNFLNDDPSFKPTIQKKNENTNKQQTWSEWGSSWYNWGKQKLYEKKEWIQTGLKIVPYAVKYGYVAYNDGVSAAAALLVKDLGKYYLTKPSYTPLTNN